MVTALIIDLKTGLLKTVTYVPVQLPPPPPKGVKS